MPVGYEIHADQGYVLATYAGDVTVSEVFAMFQAFQNDPEFDPALAHLTDLSRLATVDVGFSEIFSLFSLYSRSYTKAGETMRTAIYTPDDTVFGLTRIFENLAETTEAVEARVFDDFQAAEAWASRA